MPKATKHCQIRFERMFGSDDTDVGRLKLIKRFEKEKLLAGLEPSIPNTRLFNLSNLKRLILRCIEYEIPVFGIERSLERFNHYVLVKEEFTLDESDNEWVYDAIRWLEKEGITEDLFISYEIPDELLN